MNTDALPGVAAYLLSMSAIGAIEPLTLVVGVTTIADIKKQYTIIEDIGTSYTGGPVLNLSDWEINVEGIMDVQLAFNADGVLDVATVKADIEYFDDLRDSLISYLSQEPTSESDGLQNITFYADSTEVVLEGNPLDAMFTVNYISAEFRSARNKAQKSYA